MFSHSRSQLVHFNINSSVLHKGAERPFDANGAGVATPRELAQVSCHEMRMYVIGREDWCYDIETIDDDNAYINVNNGAGSVAMKQRAS